MTIEVFLVNFIEFVISFYKMAFPKKLQLKIQNRIDTNSLRTLSLQSDLVDFSSNDYLGFSKSKSIFEKTHRYLIEQNLQQNGATGSRLLAGNQKLHEEVELELTSFFNVEAALIFNAGYDANIGLFSSVPQKGDIVFYDEYIHASIRDGIRLSNAKSYRFKHNDLIDLEKKIKRLKYGQHQNVAFEIFIVTESVFSMDGNSPDLIALSQLCKKYKVYLIVDEAHAVGVFGKKGKGLIEELGLEKEIFARVITFGKAMGCHGAAILGTEELRNYLINFARSFIYTTALPVHALATIKMVFQELIDDQNRGEQSQLIKLKNNIHYFNQQVVTNYQQLNFIKSNSAIHCCIISGNEKVKTIANKLNKEGFDVKPILSPTVPKNKERLRICLHANNTIKEINRLLQSMSGGS